MLNSILSNLTTTVKSFTVPVRVMKAHRGRRGKAPLILNLSDKRMPVINITLPCYLLNRQLGGPHRRSEHFGKRKKFLTTVGIRTPDRRTRTLVKVMQIETSYATNIIGITYKICQISLNRRTYRPAVSNRKFDTLK